MAIHRGKVVSFDSGTWTATVRIDGSPQQTLTTVPVARNIPSAEMTSSRKVLLDTGDHFNPADFILFAVWP